MVLGFTGGCYTNPSNIIVPYIYPTPPAASITSSILNDTICSGDTVTFTATPGYQNYAFYNGSSLQQSGPSNTWTTDQLGQGNSVSVVASNNGCNAPQSNVIITFVKPTPLVLTTVANSTICQGTPATIIATPNTLDTYDFYINSTSVQFNTQSTYTSSTFANNDTITVSGTLNGCTSGLSYPIVMTVNPTPVVTLSSTSGGTICQGASVTFTASPAGDSIYEFFNGSNVVQNSSSATYTTNTLTTGSSISVVAINEGCPSLPSDTVTVIVTTAPVVNAGSDQSACLNAATITLGGFSPPGGSWSGIGITDTTGIFLPSNAGVGSFSLVYNYEDFASGCSGTDSIVFTVNSVPNVTVSAPVNICANQSAVISASGGMHLCMEPVKRFG